MLEHNHNVRDSRHHSHDKSDVGVSQDTLHHYLILNFGEEVVSHLGIEDLLDSDWSVVESSLVDD